MADEPTPQPPQQPTDLESTKRGREDDVTLSENEDPSKKQKVGDDVSDKSSLDEPGRVELGPKVFGSSVEIFDYFYKLLHHWPAYVNFNKYESLALLDLLKKGHQEPESKIGGGVKTFQIRNHPMWKSKCYFVIREDGSVEDFSFRKCVDRILPLPEDMKIKPNVNRDLGAGRGRGGGRRGGRGRGGRGRR